MLIKLRTGCTPNLYITSLARHYTSYMIQANIPYNPASGLEQSLTQKLVHLYLTGYESWTDWRRTGFPALTPAVGGAQSTIPRRQGYPTNEKAINGVSYQEAVARQSADNLSTRMRWDK